jgi:methionyl aminopeptidase
MVLCVEPMINMGTKDVVSEKDGWNVTTRDRKPSAHYEFMVVVRKGEAEILTDYSRIEKN